MKSIWIFNHYAWPPQLSPWSRTHNFALRLAAGGCKVTVFSASAIHNTDKNLITDDAPYTLSEVDGVNYVYINTRSYSGNGKKRILNMLDYYFGLFKVTKAFDKPDIIYASSPHPLALRAAIKLAKRHDVPSVCEVRDLWPESIVAYGILGEKHPAVLALRYLEHWIYKKSDALVFTMEGAPDYIRERGWQSSVKLDKLFYINNGVDIEAFDRNVAENALDDAYLDDSDSFKAVYTGTLRKMQNVYMLVDAARILKEQEPKIKLLIYGGGEELEGLREYAQKSGADNIVFKGYVEKRFIPGIVSRADLNIAHYIASPLLRFSISNNKVFEYMAAGKPILTTLDFPYNHVTDNGCGISVKQQSPQSIADALTDFAHMDKEKYNAMCAASRATAYKFDFSALTDTLRSAFDHAEQANKGRHTK